MARPDPPTDPEAHERHLERGRRFWARGARTNRANTTVHGWQEDLWRLAVDRLDLAPGRAVVDVGAGAGNALPFLREAVGASGRVLGVDFSPEMVEAARAVVTSHGWDNVDVRRADVSTDDLGHEEFDAALASFSLGAVPDLDAAVDRLHDALRPGAAVFAGDMTFGPALPARALRAFYMRVMTGNGEDVGAALARRFEGPEPLRDKRGRDITLAPGRSWPPWSFMLFRKPVAG